jgi:hypothetical protein
MADDDEVEPGSYFMASGLQPCGMETDNAVDSNVRSHKSKAEWAPFAFCPVLSLDPAFTMLT